MVRMNNRSDELENPSDLTKSKILNLAQTFPNKDLSLDSASLLATGDLRMHPLPRGIVVFIARMRGVRPARAQTSAPPGLQIEGRIAGASRSREIDPPHRSGEMTEGMVWVSGFAAPTKWSIEMPAQALFESVSIVYPEEFFASIAELDGDLAERSVRMIKDQVSLMRPASVRQRGVLLRMLQIDASRTGGQLLLESCALEILAETLGLQSEERPDPKGNATQITKHVTEIIDTRLHNPPTIAEIAATLRMSESRLKREFTDGMGASIGAYVTERRMGVAQDLMSSGVSIARVAAEVGYATPEAFSKAFRRHFGQSPRQFKAQVS